MNIENEYLNFLYTLYCTEYNFQSTENFILSFLVGREKICLFLCSFTRSTHLGISYVPNTILGTEVRSMKKNRTLSHSVKTINK